MAASGEEALVQLESGAHPDLVILDMNMPGLGGTGTLPKLHALRPKMPVVISTGRVDQATMDLIAAHPLTTLLPKPFSLDQLRKCLEPLLPKGKLAALPQRSRRTDVGRRRTDSPHSATSQGYNKTPSFHGIDQRSNFSTDRRRL